MRILICCDLLACHAWAQEFLQSAHSKWVGGSGSRKKCENPLGGGPSDFQFSHFSSSYNATPSFFTQNTPFRALKWLSVFFNFLTNLIFHFWRGVSAPNIFWKYFRSKCKKSFIFCPICLNQSLKMSWIKNARKCRKLIFRFWAFSIFFLPFSRKKSTKRL